MAKKKQKKPRKQKSWVATNQTPKVAVAQSLKKGFAIPEGMGN